MHIGSYWLLIYHLSCGEETRELPLLGSFFDKFTGIMDPLHQIVIDKHVETWNNISKMMLSKCWVVKHDHTHPPVTSKNSPDTNISMSATEKSGWWWCQPAKLLMLFPMKSRVFPVISSWKINPLREIAQFFFKKMMRTWMITESGWWF